MFDHSGVLAVWVKEERYTQNQNNPQENWFFSQTKDETDAVAVRFWIRLHVFSKALFHHKSNKVSE